MRLIDIIKKDVLIVLRDFKALIFIIFMPIVLIVILSLALGSVFHSDGFELDHINIAVVDESANSTESLPQGASFNAQEMSLYSVLDSDEVKSFISYEVMDETAALALLENNEISAVVTIPKGYLEDVMAGMYGGDVKTQITVLGGQQRTFESGIVSSVVTAYADTISSLSADIGVLMQVIEQNGTISQQAVAQLDIGSFIHQSVEAAQVGAVSIDSKGITARKVLNSFYYYSIAITCMFILYSAGQGSYFLHNESEDRTLARLTAAGISKMKLLFGKSFAVFCLCMIQLIVLLLFSSVVFGIEWGNPFGFIITSICVAISVTGVGVLLMVLVYRANNPRIGNVFQSVLVQVFALFGGSYIPLTTLPKFFSTVSLFTPNGLAIKAYTENVTGAPFVEILPYLLGSVGLGIALYIIGIMLYPRDRRA